MRPHGCFITKERKPDQLDRARSDSSRLILRLVQLSASQWQYLCIASYELLVARIRFSTLMANEIIDGLRERRTSMNRAARTIDVNMLSWAICVAGRYLPWRSDCLIQAMAADRWLRRHGIKPEFFLGGASDVEGVFNAHAWLRYGEITITGPGHERFVPLIEPERYARP